MSYTSMADQTSSSDCTSLQHLLANRRYLILLDDYDEKESFGNQFEKAASDSLHKLPYTWGLSSFHSLENKTTYRDIKASNISLDNIFEDWKDFSMLQKYGTKKDVKIYCWDGKMTSQVPKSIGCNLKNYVGLDEFFNLEEHKKAVQPVSSSFSALDIANYYSTQKYEDRKDLLMLKKYETKKDVGNDDCEKTSQLQDKFIHCNLKKFEESFSQDKRKETVQRFISCLIATVMFFWIIFDTCPHSSIIQLQALHNEHSPIFKWFFLLEPIYTVVLVSAAAVSIVVRAPFSRLHSAMLVFWAILMLIKSAQSITEVYVPMLGILFTGCYMSVEKKPKLRK